MSIRRRLGDLAKSLDSSSVGSFLSGDSADKFQTLQWTDVSGRPNVADSATTTSIIDSAYVQARVQTYVVGLDSATGLAILDSNYMQSKVTNDVGFFIYNYDTTAGQTIMDSANEANGNAISYSEGYVMVFKNGVLLYDSDYTATSGDTIVLTSAADSGELVTVVKWASGSGGGSAYPAWLGDRAVTSPDQDNASMDYFSIATPANAASFGSYTGGGTQPGAASNGTTILYAVGNNAIYVTPATLGDAAFFGDATYNFFYTNGTSDGTYGLFAGHGNGYQIVYFTIATAGTASTFGNLAYPQGKGRCAGVNDATRAVWGGGEHVSVSTPTTDAMCYATIATAADASSFGSLTVAKQWAGGANDETYGVFMGGNGNVIDYITIQTTSNASDFGDLAISGYSSDAGCDNTYAVATIIPASTSNNLQYITVATPSNASDFGDLTATVRGLSIGSGLSA